LRTFFLSIPSKLNKKEIEENFRETLGKVQGEFRDNSQNLKK
jgi:hypothetical protein